MQHDRSEKTPIFRFSNAWNQEQANHKINPSAMKIDQEIFYSSIAKYYNQIFPLNEKQLEFVQSSLAALDGKKILDIGCSTGQLAKKLAGLGSQVTGLDLNEKMIALAQKENHFPDLQPIRIVINPRWMPFCASGIRWFILIRLMKLAVSLRWLLKC